VIKTRALDLLIEGLRMLNVELDHPALRSVLFLAELLKTWEEEHHGTSVGSNTP
jgi:hypothetical protein